MTQWAGIEIYEDAPDYTYERKTDFRVWQWDENESMGVIYFHEMG